MRPKLIDITLYKKFVYCRLLFLKVKLEKCCFKRRKKREGIRLNINSNVYNNGYIRYLRKSLFYCAVNKSID